MAKVDDWSEHTREIVVAVKAAEAAGDWDRVWALQRRYQAEAVMRIAQKQAERHPGREIAGGDDKVVIPPPDPAS